MDVSFNESITLMANFAFYNSVRYSEYPVAFLRDYPYLVAPDQRSWEDTSGEHGARIVGQNIGPHKRMKNARALESIRSDLGVDDLEVSTGSNHFTGSRDRPRGRCEE